VKKALDTLNATGPLSCILVGIESHICITQTTIDLIRAGHKVYVIADGVSSCNKEEVPIALARLRHEGAVVTTSESFLYECVGDAGTPEYVRELLTNIACSALTHFFPPGHNS
jgi:isochorismate hydrolase